MYPRINKYYYVTIAFHFLELLVTWYWRNFLSIAIEWLTEAFHNLAISDHIKFGVRVTHVCYFIGNIYYNEILHVLPFFFLFFFFYRGLHSNEITTIHTGAFKDLPMLDHLYVYNCNRLFSRKKNYQYRHDKRLFRLGI